MIPCAQEPAEELSNQKDAHHEHDKFDDFGLNGLSVLARIHGLIFLLEKWTST
jgi:hypothetical protein